MNIDNLQNRHNRTRTAELVEFERTGGIREFDSIIEPVNRTYSARYLSFLSRMLAPLTDIIEAAHQPQFPCSKVSLKTG